MSGRARSLRRLRALAAAMLVIGAFFPRPAVAAGGAPIRLAMSEENLPAASATAAASAAPSQSPAPAANATPLPAASPAAAASSSQLLPDESQPGAASTAVLSRADLSNVPLSAPVSASSLVPLIEKTTDASLVASLRVTEQARVQLGENHPDEAIRTLGHALSIDADNPYAYFYLGRAWLMKKEYRQALTFFSRAELGLGSNPPWLGETVSFEGVCYEELNRDQDAALAYQRAVQLAPGNLMARAGYGRLAADLPPPPVPPEEQPSADNADQTPPEENDIRVVPEGEPLETAPPAEAPPPATAPAANGSP
ncbi:MAG TPA: tetratricopeptide repeat protein [Candidatus Binataceae bacterium]|nr:tetratricopeptide repeat protein [Candidatus Binataceae bacterium]